MEIIKKSNIFVYYNTIMTKPILIRRELLIEKYDGFYMSSKIKYINGRTLTPDTKYWFDKKGNLHRNNDKPAIITERGSLHWYQHGELHRENNKPAIIFYNNDKHCYKHGVFYKKKKITWEIKI